VNINAGRGSNRGRGRGRHGGRSGNTGGGNRMRVVMNGVDVTDVARNFTSDDWDKLRACGGHTYVYQRRDFLSGNSGRGGGRDTRGGRGGRGGRGNHTGRHNDRPATAEERNVSAVNVTDIVEYDASTSSITTQSTSSNDRGGRTGGRFGPRQND
jgi:hypothetical protein